VIKGIRAFGRFWYDFVVGDDPLIAVVVFAAIGTTAWLYAAGVTAWWLLPAATFAVVAVSVWREAARQRR
jgi:hypothetical protein